jgi:hypothetical protein
MALVIDTRERIPGIVSYATGAPFKVSHLTGVPVPGVCYQMHCRGLWQMRSKCVRFEDIKNPRGRH